MTRAMKGIVMPLTFAAYSLSAICAVISLFMDDVQLATFHAVMMLLMLKASDSVQEEK